MRKIFVTVFMFMIILSAQAYAVRQTVVDEADYLAAYEETELEQSLEQVSENHGFDIAVVIVNSLDGKSAQDYADDYYDYNGYGIGANDDGLLLLISKEPRKYHISTHKMAVKIFNDNALDILAEEVEAHLRNDDYFEACMTFAETADDIASGFESGDRYSLSVSLDNAAPFIGAAIAALIAAVAMTAVAYKSMNTARVKADADNYIKQGSFELKKSNDIFLYSNLVKTKIESSSSGGSTHRSSSGRSHGGRGGSY